MANAASLKGHSPYRGMHVGFPGSGKTGALASLANAGYKLRVLDFEGNFDPLVGFADEKALANIDIVVLQDQMRNGDKYVDIVGIPDAFNRANKLMTEWKYDDNGTEVNLGKSADWGTDTVVVIDSLTSLSNAVFRRAMKMNNKTPSNITSSVWGHAVADLTNFLAILKSRNHHLIVNAHLQMLGPSDFIQQGDADDVKEKKLEVIGSDMIPTRYYPISVTKPNAMRIHGELPIMLQFEKKTKLGKDIRVIKTSSGPEIDVKLPTKLANAEYNIESGLADIFKALGHVPPGLK